MGGPEFADSVAVKIFNGRKVLADPPLVMPDVPMY